VPGGGDVVWLSSAEQLRPRQNLPRLAGQFPAEKPSRTQLIGWQDYIRGMPALRRRCLPAGAYVAPFAMGAKQWKEHRFIRAETADLK
jgi:hypothetical protein